MLRANCVAWPHVKAPRSKLLLRPYNLKCLKKIKKRPSFSFFFFINSIGFIIFFICYYCGFELISDFVGLVDCLCSDPSENFIVKTDYRSCEYYALAARKLRAIIGHRKCTERINCSSVDWEVRKNRFYTKKLAALQEKQSLCHARSSRTD